MSHKVVVSASEPDWEREKVRGCWDPSRRLLAAIRGYQSATRRRGVYHWARRKWHALAWQFWSHVCGAEIPINGSIAGGLLLPHPNGVVIHPDAQIGPNCLLFQQVTLGSGGKHPGFPKLGGHVDVGAGAKILGGVVVGDHAKIGANAVVIDHVPPGATAVGVPARVIEAAAARPADPI